MSKNTNITVIVYNKEKIKKFINEIVNDEIQTKRNFEFDIRNTYIQLNNSENKTIDLNEIKSIIFNLDIKSIHELFLEDNYDEIT